jgi:protein-S-isoprenylcysteine O-methyltransferase Ste14
MGFDYKELCRKASIKSEESIKLPGLTLFGVELTYRMDQFINIQKFLTIFACLAMMCLHKAYTPYHWIYTAFHGFYGFAWIARTYVAPDLYFAIKLPFWALVQASFVIYGYWLIIWWTMKETYTPARPSDPERAFWAAACCFYGCFLVFGSDIQKGIQLKFKKGLITDGFFATTRNPNYLGEIILY